MVLGTWKQKNLFSILGDINPIMQYVLGALYIKTIQVFYSWDGIMNASVSWISAIVLLQITPQNVLHCGNVQVGNFVSVLFDQLIKFSRCLYSVDLLHNFFLKFHS